MIRERYARFAERDDVPFGRGGGRARAAAVPALPFAGAEAAPTDTRSTSAAARPRSSPRPATAPGHVAAWLPARGLLAAGDAVMGTRRSRRATARC